jgi:hypothetical protein
MIRFFKYVNKLIIFVIRNKILTKAFGQQGMQQAEKGKGRRSPHI